MSSPVDAPGAYVVVDQVTEQRNRLDVVEPLAELAEVPRPRSLSDVGEASQEAAGGVEDDGVLGPVGEDAVENCVDELFRRRPMTHPPTEKPGTNPREARSSDPTLVRNQPAIGQGRRRQWLVPAALLAAITIGLMIIALDLQTAVPVAGIVIVSTLLAAMVVVALVVEATRRRNILSAWLMSTMGLAALTLPVLLLIGQARSS